jgi:hypothetical protein
MNKHLNKNYFTTSVYPNLRKLGKSVTNCTTEATLYTNCCTTKSLNINQYECQKEYEKLMSCVRINMKKLK